MLHACAARFDVTENIENFLDFGVNWAMAILFVGLGPDRGTITCVPSRSWD